MNEDVCNDNDQSTYNQLNQLHNQQETQEQYHDLENGHKQMNCDNDSSNVLNVNISSILQNEIQKEMQKQQEESENLNDEYQSSIYQNYYQQKGLIFPLLIQQPKIQQQLPRPPSPLPPPPLSLILPSPPPLSDENTVIDNCILQFSAKTSKVSPFPDNPTKIKNDDYDDDYNNDEDNRSIRKDDCIDPNNLLVNNRAKRLKKSPKHLDENYYLFTVDGIKSPSNDDIPHKQRKKIKHMNLTEKQPILYPIVDYSSRYDHLKEYLRPYLESKASDDYDHFANFGEKDDDKESKSNIDTIQLKDMIVQQTIIPNKSYQNECKHNSDDESDGSPMPITPQKLRSQEKRPNIYSNKKRSTSIKVTKKSPNKYKNGIVGTKKRIKKKYDTFAPKSFHQRIRIKSYSSNDDESGNEETKKRDVEKYDFHKSVI